MVSGGGSPSGPRSMWGELAPPTAPQERLCHGSGGADPHGVASPGVARVPLHADRADPAAGAGRRRHLREPVPAAEHLAAAGPAVLRPASRPGPDPGPAGRVRRLRRALVHGHLPGAADGADRLPGAAADRLPAAGARPTPPAAAAPGPLPQLRELPGVGLARAGLGGRPPGPAAPPLPRRRPRLRRAVR